MNKPGNPLHDNAYFYEMKEYFKSRISKFGELSPICWTKKKEFKYYIISDDYRLTQVFNIPHLLGIDCGQTDNIFRAIGTYLIKIRRCNPDASRRISEIEYENNLKTQLSDSKGVIAVEDIKKFLGNNFSIDNLFTCLCQVSKIYASSDFGNYIDSVRQFIKKHRQLNLATYIEMQLFSENRSKLENERYYNNAMAFENLIECIVCAIDQRDFWSFNPITKYRRNDGYWCDFIEIKNMPGLLYYTDKRLKPALNYFIDVIRNILNKDNYVDLDMLERHLECNSISRSIKWVNDSEKITEIFT